MVRMVSFERSPDGLGSKVRLEREGGDLWRVVGKYDRKDRMI